MPDRNRHLLHMSVKKSEHRAQENYYKHKTLAFIICGKLHSSLMEKNQTKIMPLLILEAPTINRKRKNTFLVAIETSRLISFYFQY